jgi:hypothetical protein
MVSGFSHRQQYILFYLDNDMFRLLDHHQAIFTKLRVRYMQSGFGGLVVRMLASGTQVRGFKPGRSRRIFRGEKILSMPSFGGK